MSETTFTLIRRRYIESLNLEAQEYRHTPTGTMHLHLACEDPQNAFMVAFKTLPQDSTGVAHILEHTTLCGSRRFPVRDPFFMMTRRSLNTFMNAFTGADWTAYPFASLNRKDFNNLLEVYLDAVFFPTLAELDFAQEGHRLEFAEPDNPASELVYKGVVYNEMKGAMSSPVARLWHTFYAELFPTTTYHYNSGGEPEHIPELSYAELKDFHARYYHPSNAVFATYGNFSVMEHQQRIHDLALQYFDYRPLPIALNDEQRYTEPRAITAHYALDEPDTAAKTHIVLGWLLGNTTEVATTLGLQLLEGVLLGNSASPLRLALEASDLGLAPSELCGLSLDSREGVFICGLEGSEPEHADALEDLVLSVLTGIAEHGVPPAMIEAALHQLELAQREIRGGYPYGLQLLSAAAPMAIRGGDPIAILDLDEALEQLRKDAHDPKFLQQLARQWLVDNPHRVRLVLGPDQKLSGQQTSRVREALARRRATMAAAERQHIIAQASALAARQQEQQDPEVLPKVDVADIPPTLTIPEGQTGICQQAPVTWFQRGTNGLVYLHLVTRLPALSQEEQCLLPLYNSFLTEVGCGERDYLAAQSWQTAISGGINAQIVVCAAPDDAQAFYTAFRLGTDGLARNLTELAELLRETFLRARFDELERLEELTDQLYTARASSVVDHGHQLAIAAASARHTSLAALAHGWDGLQGLGRLKELQQRVAASSTQEELAARLQAIHTKISRGSWQFLLIGEERHRESLLDALAQTWPVSTRVEVAEDCFSPDATLLSRDQAWLTSTEVNFCARAYPAVPLAHLDSAVFMVLGKFLHDGVLHRTLREQGGAYGAGANYDGDLGLFRLFSYRDPRLAETFVDFDKAIDWLHRHPHTYRQLEEAILGVISAIDRPSSPAGEAVKAFMGAYTGRSPQFRQQLRQRVLRVTIEDLQRVAANYLRPECLSNAVLTSERMAKTCEALGMELQRV